MSAVLRRPPPQADHSVPIGEIRQASHNAGDFVYFIKPIGMNGPVKIGCSKSPVGRKIVLAQWSPFPLEIAAQIPGDFTLERRFHALFGDHHKSGEWFGWSPELDAVIAAVRDGTFDVETLPAPKSLKTDRGGKTGKRSIEARINAARLRADIGRLDPHIKTIHDDGTVSVGRLLFIPISTPARRAAA